MSKIHDNIIKSYFVDLENHKIIFNTVYRDEEITTIEFSNVMGYLFSSGITVGIIFDITEYSIDEYMKIIDAEVLNEKENYDFPFKYNDEEELINKLNEENQRYYMIESSYGLYGWILAEEMKILVKSNTRQRGDSCILTN
ncbi:MAG: hypothetical protein LBJ88_01125 [Campylobacteraceae bacterium]|jgi:hypothetical protein|nr:hypothetical protein [Campylobacteraceae bacterium]